MADSLRGNLGLKSSPLAPTACKLSTQYLVLDHMTNHYNKIAKARSVIDTKPPKSLSTSQKMRDRRNRELRIGSPRLQKSLSRSHSDLKSYHDLLNDEPEDEDGRLVHSIMKATLYGQPDSSYQANYGSTSNQDSYNLTRSMMHKQGGDTQLGVKSSRPVSARSTQSMRSARSGHSVTSMTSRVTINTHDPAKVTYQGDLLDKRAHLFTEPDRAFTPRTLKANHESKLKNSKWYNPPRRSSSQSRALPETKENSGPKPTSASKRQKPDVSPGRDASEHYLQDTAETAHLSESMLMDMTLRSRDEQRLHEGGHLVPPLAISMDQDHMSWLQEQASKAEVRARSKGKLKSSLHSDEEPYDQSSKSKGTDLRDAIKLEKKNKWHTLLQPVHLQPSEHSWISQRLLEEDEEQKYLNFAREVTGDVRSRGICADSVLHRVFENHIERRKHELDEGRMRQVINDLKINLGVPEHVPPVINYSSRRKGSHSSILETESTKSLSFKDDSLTTSIDNTLSAPAYNFSGHADHNSTLDSTSTMKFGKTGDMLSTINSDGAQGDGEGNIFAGDDLTTTQVLKQYQLDITIKEAAGDLTSIEDSSLADTNSSHQLSRIERPATGERRVSENEEKMSEISAVNNYSRTKRRESMKKAHEVDPSSSSITENDHSGRQNGMFASHNLTMSEDAIGDDSSVKSALSSSKPVAKPRGSRSGASISQPHQAENTDTHDEVPGEKGAPHGRCPPSPEHRSVSNHSETNAVDSQDKTDDEYEDDYEEEIDEGNEADEDDEQGTHRTSDDDF